MFNVFQILGSLGVRKILDGERLLGQRRNRGIFAIIALTIVVVGGWAGLVAWLYGHPLESGDKHPPLWDWTRHGSDFSGFFVIELVLGVNMAVYQVIPQWIVASLTNDPETLASYAGIAKGILAAGNAASFGIEASGISQLRVVAFCFSVQAVGLVCMAVVCGKYVRPTCDDEVKETSASEQEKKKDDEPQPGYGIADEE